jgi:hypothetical protein
MKIEDVGTSVEELDTLLQTISDSFAHVIRLSNSVTQIKGPASKLLGNYVDLLH